MVEIWIILRLKSQKKESSCIFGESWLRNSWYTSQKIMMNHDFSGFFSWFSTNFPKFFQQLVG